MAKNLANDDANVAPAAVPAAKVLIVEDEFLLALQLEDIVADGGHTVVATAADRASLDHASLDRFGIAPDVALVDLNLRDGLTGPAIARDLASRYGSLVIYVTANPGQIDLPAETAVGIVTKPFSQATILAAIAYALAGCPDHDRPSDLQPLRQMR